MEENGTAEQRDVEELENELETQKSRLDLVIATNPGVIDQYERRRAEVRIGCGLRCHRNCLTFLFH